MKIFLSDQTLKFSHHLAELKTTPIIPYHKKDLVEKVSSVLLDLDFSQVNFSTFFNYEIFPKYILTFLTQWQDEERTMRVGDTILQQVFFPPLGSVSQKIIFGVRICEIIDTETKKGFSYETLAGHLEKGISTFSIERTREGSRFKIHTFSKPGNTITQILGPIFSVPYQTFCTKVALSNVKKRLESITKV